MTSWNPPPAANAAPSVERPLAAIGAIVSTLAAGCTSALLAEVDEPQTRVRMLTSLLRTQRASEIGDGGAALPAPTVSAAPLLRRLTPEEWEARYPRSAAP